MATHTIDTQIQPLPWRQWAAIGAVTVLLLAILAAFAVELADTQRNNRRVITAQLRDRAELAGSLINAELQSTTTQLPMYTREFGGAHIGPTMLAPLLGSNPYLALLDAHGHVLTSVGHFNRQARANLSNSAALKLIRQGDVYAIGNVLPYGKTGVINFALRLNTVNGERILLEGVYPQDIVPLVIFELRKIPGVKGSRNSLIDGTPRVIATTYLPAQGRVLDTPAQRKNLSVSSGTTNGRYYVQVSIPNTSWRLLLSAPASILFASVSGAHVWVPWLILAGFALAALIAIAQQPRLLRTSATLRLANARLKIAVDDLAQFATTAAHDLRAPLRHISSFATYLHEMIEEGRLIEADGGTEGLDYARWIEERVRDLDQLIVDLIAYARSGQTETKKRVDILPTIDAVTDRLGIRDVVSVRGEFATVLGDKAMIAEMLGNILSNAVKFHAPDKQPVVTVQGSIDMKQVTIAIADQGIGIDPKYLVTRKGETRSIFEPFVRLHTASEFPGTGIGLAVTKRVVQQMQGSITVEPNHQGQGGTVFTVRLPREH